MALFGGSKSGIKKALDVVLAAAEGDYEARITNVDSHADMRELFIAINRLIDRNDAFLRESAASMGAVSENRYYRLFSAIVASLIAWASTNFIASPCIP